MDSENVFDYIYQAAGKAPWTFKEPPKELAGLVESGVLKPCKMLDVGCGEGYISLYFASKGFDVTGVDISGNAIKLAKSHSGCKFVQQDWRDLKGKYDFVLDWRFLHEITDDKDREKYVSIVSGLLDKGGIYLSAAFSGLGNRKSPIGVLLYMAADKDLEKLFGRDFEIVEKKKIKLPQKDVLGSVTGYFFLMKKK